ncbi:MAG: sporulation protein Cse60 [Bacilli bacterium]|nr:sporulation protein Cse60 [Bacilli bacterium]
MKVKIFDCDHEKDLEKRINEFLINKGDNVIDIKFSTSVMLDEKSEQIYCFSALIIYKD